MRLFSEIGSANKRLVVEPAEGGTVHCSHDCWVHHDPLVFDWIERYV